jgi:hypothetical protein
MKIVIVWLGSVLFSWGFLISIVYGLTQIGFWLSG